MKQHLGIFLSLSAVALLTVLTGCGPTGPALATTTGTVTLGGQPVEGATVTFVSVTDPSAVGSGITDGSGKFAIKTAGKDGAPVGKCNVGISKGGGAGATLSEDEAKNMTMKTIDPAAMLKADKSSQLPAQYASPGSSGLSQTVEAGKTNDFTFNLEGSGAAPAATPDNAAPPAGDAKPEEGEKK